MKNLRNSLKSSGYDSEEAYFYAREQELIQKMRALNEKENSPPKLTLLPGGASNQQVEPRAQNKKAA